MSSARRGLTPTTRNAVGRAFTRPLDRCYTHLSDWLWPYRSTQVETRGRKSFHSFPTSVDVAERPNGSLTIIERNNERGNDRAGFYAFGGGEPRLITMANVDKRERRVGGVVRENARSPAARRLDREYGILARSPIRLKVRNRRSERTRSVVSRTALKMPSI